MKDNLLKTSLSGEDAPTNVIDESRIGANSGRQASASLYFGKVMHARMKPVEHRFTYRVFSVLIDIDELAKANNMSRLFSVNCRGLVAFQECDHGYRDDRPLRQFVDDQLAGEEIASPHRVILLAYPRVMGYAFNPLSVYFCYDEAGQLCALLYQVHNTFGGDHTYVRPVASDNSQTASVRQHANKQFYVSPFIEMDMQYRFRVTPPGDTVTLRILETDAQGPLLSATFSGKHKKLSAKNLALGLLQTAGLTWKVTAGIHFEALRLWMKGLKLVPREGLVNKNAANSAGNVRQKARKFAVKKSAASG